MSLALSLARSCLPGILEKWHRGAVLGEPRLEKDFWNGMRRTDSGRAERDTIRVSWLEIWDEGVSAELGGKYVCLSVCLPGQKFPRSGKNHKVSFQFSLGL